MDRILVLSIISKKFNSTIAGHFLNPSATVTIALRLIQIDPSGLVALILHSHTLTFLIVVWTRFVHIFYYNI